MPDVEKRLEGIERKLDQISETLSKVAIQGERIDHLEKRTHDIWTRYDALVSPDGIVSRIREHQASCPRGQVRTMWAIILPMGLTLLGMGIALLKVGP